MIQTARVLVLAAALLISGAACAEAPLADTPAAEAAPGPKSEFAELVKRGRGLFQQRHFQEALDAFTRAVELQPGNREICFLKGLSAYWTRQPQSALDVWDLLLDTAKRNSTEEWDLERHRVLALSACGRQEAAEWVVERLYELRQRVKLKAALGAQGFVREHIHQGPLRAGAWEVFDERGEAQDLWTFPVTLADGSEDAPRKLFAVQRAALPGGGGTGFCFSEEGPGYRRVYKYWMKRPEYAGVRALLLQALESKLTAVDSQALDNAGRFSAAPPPNDAPGATPAGRAWTEKELMAIAQAEALRAAPEVKRILLIAARLRDIAFDVAASTRLSMTDPELSERQLKGLLRTAPYAREDAAELIDALNRSKAEHAQAAFAQWVKQGERKPYLDFTLLTAANTRGRDIPKAFLEQSAASPDFTVRQTACLLLARAGEIRGPSQLFKELETADTAGTVLLAYAIEDSIGGVPKTPASDLRDEAAWSAWKKEALRWWRENSSGLQFVPAAPPETGLWKIKDTQR